MQQKKTSPCSCTRYFQKYKVLQKGIFPMGEINSEPEKGLKNVIQGRDDTYGYQFWLGTGNGNFVVGK